jgi:transposase
VAVLDPVVGPRHRHLARWTHQQVSRPDRRRWTPTYPADLARQYIRHDAGTRADRVARGRFDRQLTDCGFDSNAIRAAIAAQGAEVVIPLTRSRKMPIPYGRKAYRARNLVERLWCRLKDWRRIATRYDKLAINYMAGAFSSAIITFWCN